MFNLDFNRFKSCFKAAKELSFQELAALLKIPEAEHASFGIWLGKRYLDGQLYLSQTNKTYSLTRSAGSLIGEIRVNEKNFAFVGDVNNSYPSKSEAVFVGGKHFNGALNGDIVEVDVYQILSEEGRSFGIVKRIIERKINTLILITTYSEWLNKLFLKPLDNRLKGIFELENLDQLPPSFVIEARIISYKKGRFQLKKTRDIGDFNEANNDVKAVLIHYGIEDDWPEEVKAELAGLKEVITKEEYQSRIDLTEKLVFTIDGERTKDFDDALSIEADPVSGNYKVGVHIADVANYVKANTALDREAKRRATSIYFLDNTIPMLPLPLSANLCSLVANQTRLTLTLELEVDKLGNCLEYKLYPSIIKSRYRLTYRQVNAFFAGKRNATAHLTEALRNLAKVAALFRAKREAEGYVDLDISEAVIYTNNDGSTKTISLKKRGIAERIVEDMMVKANEIVAAILKKEGLPAIYRNHPKPTPERLEYLKMLCAYLKLDYDLTIEQNYGPKQFCAIVNQAKERGLLTNFSRQAFLKTLEKAIYSTQDSQHFALALDNYLHFTSPIRRYPDLFVHRILKMFVIAKPDKVEQDKLKEELTKDLEQIALNSSKEERRASDLEQDIHALKRARFYKQRLGKHFKAEIVSIERSGIFCELEDKTSAFLKFTTLEESFTIESFEAKSRSYHFKAGDIINVTILEVDRESFSARILLDLK